MNALAYMIDLLVDLYIWVLIASAVLSWLVALNMANRSHPAVAKIGDLLHRLTEPALRPIRRILPSIGGVDLSPIALILLLVFLRRLFFEYA